MTLFKKVAEYVISAVFLASLGLLWWRRRDLGSVPLWLLALLILPLRVLLQLLPTTRLPAEWIRPMALAILGALYSFAGSRENRRAILLLGVVLLLAALTTLYDSYGEVMLSALFG